ncbi:FSR family fosmidomycin resistance protein-like MFS transporter [Bradyrhizobium japonicum]|uniref:FSR family fosmidomycin resistance protein-like MFS transporter n=1 Tax=Bradyrhizobium elkanii TaxID=29448 RepID=A0ABV4FFW1_BRAEL|nr:MFS transporter [Bradyrhizobium elkanii]MBP2430510.1 MFS family permease [Bradyrhizobium elkanii]MCP1736150.1 MFS family permease [Bradyrhizobium elkanii]MCP1753947.1 MFS family permease [Bradyrhizobium elkanii]MCP1979467.1 MFS family permease [Bradyrhizobium elkanii]MCS3571491.1 MFS family permease [Bradyrhizobium elkanii]
MSVSAETGTTRPDRARSTRTLTVTGLNHALHDGYTDVIYVLLPVWQAEFALSYGLLALLRGLYAGAMAGLQIPVGRIAERIDGKIILIAGTALSALGYAFAGFSGGVIGLGLALALSGAGSSTQHPIASAAVSRAYGTAARGPLGVYNFSGDLGKAAIPALTSILLVIMSWRHTLLVLAFAGLLVAVCIALWMPSVGKGAEHKATSASRGASTGGGFRWLLAIGILDTAVRMGFLTFLPFLLRDKGASLPTNGLALALVFIGGAAGKFTCGWLGERVGTLRTVLITEGGTAALIAAVLALPLAPAIVLLPLLGVMLNGTSSVLYGTVPELTPAHQTERAFALFYTGTIGSGAIAPVLYGLLGDALGPTLATAATALTALAICPLAVALARHLADDQATASP